MVAIGVYRKEIRICAISFVKKKRLIRTDIEDKAHHERKLCLLRRGPGMLRVCTRYFCMLLVSSLCFVTGFALAADGDENETSFDNNGTTAIAFGGRLLGDDQSARLLIDLDKKVELRPFYMNNPPRLVIDMSKTAFRFSEPDQLKPRGLVAGFRYGTMARGHSRIVMSLASPVKIVTREIEMTENGRYRFKLDIEKASLPEFIASIELQRETIGKSGNIATKGDRLKQTSKRSGRLIIVIDPGHGGIDGGAKGANGSIEKQITLEVARQLQEALRNAGPFDVYLTRNEDYFLSLKERLKFTIRKKADLFVSIHADTLRQKDVRGATVYTLSKKASDDLSKNLAESENRADLIAGLARQEVKNEVVDILADLAARETKRFSVRFARQLVDGLRGEIRLIKNPHRFAAFGVLKDPNVPSILLELGYLSNLEDEKLLQSTQWRSKMVRHLTQSIGTFFADRIQQ